jgi:DNA-binding transcriptional ArsR family regulator
VFPDRLPTVASALAIWKAFTEDPHEGNAWGLSLDGPNGTLAVEAGWTGLALPARPITDGSTQRANATFNNVGIDGHGVVLYRTDIVAVSQRSQGLTGSTWLRSSSGGNTTALAGVFAFPGLPAAAGLSAMSVLLAAAYYLWPLAKSGSLGLFSRVRESDLLENPVRRRLMSLVEAQPGIHYQALVRGSGAGKGATEHHLRKLTGAGLIVRRAGAGFTCYFPTGSDPALAAAAPALKSDGARRILQAIRRAPGLSASAVALGTGLDPATVTHHVQRLRSAGLVDADRVGRSLALRPTALGQAASVGAADALPAAS